MQTRQMTKKVESSRAQQSVAKSSGDGHSGDNAPSRKKGSRDQSDEDGEGDENVGDAEDAEDGENSDCTTDCENNDGTLSHPRIFRKLLRQAAQGGSYVYEPERGDGDDDVTAYLQTQRVWGNHHLNLPHNLSLWERPANFMAPTYPLRQMRYKGRGVVDYEDKPIRDFHNLPATISSAVEGLRLESWLREEWGRLTNRDIAARCKTKETASSTKEPITKIRNLSQRTKNFRPKVGCISWRAFPGRDRAKAFLDGLRSTAQRANNRTLERLLTKQELDRYFVLGARRTVAGGPAPAAAAPPAPANPVAGINSEDSEDSEEQDGDEGDKDEGMDAVSAGISEDSIKSNPEDPSDSRNDVPITVQGRAQLADALRGTRENFRELTGQEPFVSPAGENYLSQWADLQTQYEALRHLQGGQGRAPTLFALGRWTGGIVKWDTAVQEVVVNDVVR